MTTTPPGARRRDSRSRPAGPALRFFGFLAAVLAGLVIACYTLLKSRVSVPGLWDAAVHQRRELRLIPLHEFLDPYVWWGPPLNLLGNTAMFIPVGFLLVLVFAPRRPLPAAALTGFALSLTIEITQFVFALGYSDIDDLIFNTLGAVLGAVLATRLSRQGRLTLVGLIIAGSILAALPFAVALL